MFDQSTVHVDQVFLFGPFSLSAKQRLLLENGEQVRLGSRAIEMLIVLIEQRGGLVGKDELFARVWPHTFVSAANLTAQMTILRRTLHDGRGGNRYIVNEAGRGYRFVAPVVTAEAQERALQAPAWPASRENASRSFRRLVELCYGFIGPSPTEQLSSPGERVTVDAILQRGILALEFARALVSADQPDAVPPAAARPVEDGPGIARFVSHRLEAGYPAAPY